MTGRRRSGARRKRYNDHISEPDVHESPDSDSTNRISFASLFCLDVRVASVLCLLALGL